MNSIKKVVALVIVLTMMLGCVSVFAYTDVPADLTDAVTALSALGVFVGYPDGTFKPDGAITRAEVAAVSTRLLGAGSLAQAQRDTVFADVPASHWASGYIAFANEHDVVIGFPDGNFYPDQQVTYEQMVKILICTMGYGLKAEAEGGYPNGYLYVGNNIGLTRGVTGAVGSAAFRGIVAQLSFNSLDIPIMAQVTYGGVEMWVVEDGTSRESTVRKTLMSENLGTVKLAATITGNYLSGEKAGSVLAKIRDNYKFRYSYDYEIGDEYVLDDATGKAAGLIGKPVILFAKISNTTLKKAEIIWITEAIDSKTLEIEGIQLADVEAKTGEATVVTYTDENDKEKTVKIPAAGLTMYENGIEVSYSPANLMAYETQYAKLLFYKNDVDTKEEFDTVYIENYKTLLVDDVDVTNEVISGKGDGDDFRLESIEYDDEDVELIIVDKNGDTVNPGDLQEWDVLTIKEAEGTNGRVLFDCVMTREFVEGTVEETEDSELKQKLTIDDKIYGVATKGITYKNTGKFFLDANGKVAGSEEEESTNTYALVIDGLSAADTRAHLFTQDGKAVKLTLADDLRVDGSKSWPAIAEAKLVRYSTNSDNHIDRLYTADGDNDEFDNLATGKSATFYSTPRVVIRGTAGTTNLRMSAGTFIFSIETDGTFKVIKPADIANDTTVDDGTTTITAYNKNSAGNVGVVYVTGPAPISPITRIGMFSKLLDSTYDGGKVFNVRYFNKDASGVQSIYTDSRSGTIESKLAEGSVVVPTLDYDGLVKDYSVLAVVNSGLTSVAFGNGAPALEDPDNDPVGTPRVDNKIKYTIGTLKNYDKGSCVIETLAGATETFDISTSLYVPFFDASQKEGSRVSCVTLSTIGSKVDADGTPKKDTAKAMMLIVTEEEEVVDAFVYFLN